MLVAVSARFAQQGRAPMTLRDEISDKRDYRLANTLTLDLNAPP